MAPVGSARTLSRRAAAFGWLLAMTILPLALWHRPLSDTLASFRWNLDYLASELCPWLLLVTGIAFMLPVAISVGGNPESRLYPRARRTYAAWGTVIYLLGILLVVEVAAVWRLSS
jgi:hypothetical protein